MELTKEQYAKLEELSIELGVSIKHLISVMEEYASRLYRIKVETEILEMAIENIKQMEYEYCERILLQERGPLPPYRPKIIPGKGYKNRIYWKRIRSNPKQR